MLQHVAIKFVLPTSLTIYDIILVPRGAFPSSESTDWKRELEEEKKEKDELREKKKVEDLWAGRVISLQLIFPFRAICNAIIFLGEGCV